MTTRRFWHGEPDPDDARIMAAARDLEIRLLANDDGALAGYFKISGGFGADLLSGFGEEAESDPAEVLRFARGLMSAFSAAKRKPPGALL